MPLIIAPLLTVDRDAAAGALGQLVDRRGSSQHFSHGIPQAAPRPQPENVTLELDGPIESIDIAIGE